jgi:hypothetical protein
MTAYQAGLEVICTVRLWLCSVSDLPAFLRCSKVNSLIAGLRMGSGSDSVTKIRRDSTGKYPSSPSESWLVEPTAL